jgi:hypothetical protein
MENEAKSIRMLMEKKVRVLGMSQSNYRKAHATLKPRNEEVKSTVKRTHIFKGKESGASMTQAYSNLSESVNSYNHTLNTYMEYYSSMCS